jgi:hypothetical protein
MIPRTDEY